MSNSYRVKLPLLIKIYLVIPLDRLRKVAKNAMSKQYNDSLLTIVINNNIEYEVKYLLAFKILHRKL